MKVDTCITYCKVSTWIWKKMFWVRLNTCGLCSNKQEWGGSINININYLKNKKPTRCHLLYLLYFLDTQHVSGISMSLFRSMRLSCWNTTLAVSFLVCCVLKFGCGSARVVSGLPAEAQASAGSPDTTLAEPHPDSNTQQTKNEKANVVVQ